MSSWSDSQDCPMCLGKDILMTCGSNRPYDSSNGECLECGFCFYTREEQMTLDEVNEKRLDYGLDPLTKLVGQV